MDAQFRTGNAKNSLKYTDLPYVIKSIEKLFRLIISGPPSHGFPSQIC